MAKGAGVGVQDTPGLNTQEDVEVVLDYVRAQLQAYMAMEENPRRDLPMSRLADPRVDVALYLIAPHALKPHDVVAMTRLSLLVPVVPVLAKVTLLAPRDHALPARCRTCCVCAGSQPSLCFWFPAFCKVVMLSVCVAFSMWELLTMGAVCSAVRPSPSFQTVGGCWSFPR